MEILQLKYFFDSAKNESFSKTAEKYQVPVSSVSASVKRLETELGIPLFTRTGNRITLNEKGKQFFFSVKRSLDELNNGINTVANENSQPETLSILVNATRETIVRRIIKFTKFHPSISFKLDMKCSKNSPEDYDLIVDLDNNSLTDYEHIPLYRFAIRIETASTNLLCQKAITLKQLQDKPFVTTSSQHGIFKIFSEACKKQGFSPKIVLECDDYTCRDMFLLSGNAFGTTLGNTTNSSLPNVQYLDITDFNEHVTTNLYYKKESCKGAVKLFVDFIKSL